MAFRGLAADSVAFCTWENGAVDDNLYLASGKFRPQHSDYGTYAPNISRPGKNQLLALTLDLSKRPDEFIPKPNNFYSFQSGAVWTSNKKIYEFGGSVVNESQKPEAVEDLTFSIFHTESKTWTKKPLPEQLRRYEGGYTQGGGKGFYYKGKASKSSTADLTEDLFPSDLLIFDMETEDFTRADGPSLGSDSVTSPTVAYAPVGRNGIILTMGGLAPRRTIEYNVINIYDIATSTWYHQGTSGTHPPRRTGQCYVHATSPDGTSHQTFVYGGVADDNPAGYDDIYVLSVPSFTWQKVYEHRGTLARAGMACTRQGGNMIVAGGKRVMDPTKCDFDYQMMGINIFDMARLKWVSDEPYDMGRQYKVGDQISAMIDGMEMPVDGWSDVRLGALFATRPGHSNSSDDGSSRTKFGDAEVPSDTFVPSDTSVPYPEPASPRQHWATRRNIGGIVGGVVLFIILLGLALCLFHHRRRKNRMNGMEARERFADANQVPIEHLMDPTLSSNAATLAHASPVKEAYYGTAKKSSVGIAEETLRPEDSASVAPGPTPVARVARYC
ncbi:hypothetical protein BJ508DRAFT_372680 [Ascobolus immersus RN42]|uniref:Galactose oxidase n=1 Tax=Ascobolus immersus RN42 TaxID=1160509 RepID=A0A3N4IQA7_ASCIM|nr:hypothetical protein BJ508DRAFT_372680 [Ascobolus immersus RN42]